MDYFKEIKFRILNLGRVPICNCRIDRAPHYKGYSFILCWRCTSILTAYFLSKNLHMEEQLLLTKEAAFFNNFILGIMLCFPTFMDGYRQYFKKKESTNLKRISTGLLCGIGLFIITYLLKI